MKTLYSKTLTIQENFDVENYKKSLRRSLEQRGLIVGFSDKMVKFEASFRNHSHHTNFNNMRTFRRGHFKVSKIKSKVDIIGEVDLSHQLTLSISIGLVFLIPIFFQETLFAKLAFLVVGVAVGFSIFKIGASSSRKNLKYLIDESLNI